MFAHPFIDSVDFARNGKEIRGEVAIADLPRLSDSLAKPEGSLAYVVRGLREGGQDMLEISLQGACRLRCQRCLNELVYPVRLLSRLRLLPAERLDDPAEDEEELDAIEASQKLDVLTLLEDELLLELPFAPKHAEGECDPVVKDLQQKTGPFAVLAGLKK